MAWKRWIPVLGLVMMCVIGWAGNVKAEKLTLGYIEFPPFTFTNDAGKPEGILIDLASRVFPEAGYEFDAVSYPVRRLASYIGSGDLDIWMGLKTLPEFEGKAYVGESIVAELILRAYTKGNKPPIVKKEDLSGKSVIILRGYSYGGWVSYITAPENNVSYIKANKHEAAFNMLKAGRAEYLLDYKEPSDMALKTVSIPDLGYNQISALPCYFIVTRKRADGQDVINRLETVFKKLKEQGQL